MKDVVFLKKPSIEEGRSRKIKSNYVNFNFDVDKKTINFFSGKTFFIRTYGCQANIRDEEVICGILEELGLKRVNDDEVADLAILNTCAVRENAEDKVYGQIGDFKNLKSKNKDMIILICGCMVEQMHIIDKILTAFPYVDMFLGTHNIKDLPYLLNSYVLKKQRYVLVSSEEGDVVEKLPSIRSENYKAYVNISYGCDKFCSYCIVPYTRGRERSRLLVDVVEECRELVNKGYKEITLLGQNVNSYGKDLKNGDTFARLLDEVASLNIPRLRFLTSYPSDMKDDVIEVIKKHKNIMRFIHLPVQSGSDEILRYMNRRYDSTTYLELVEKIRKAIPEMEFSTDIIVGFPNETYEQFLKTIELVKKVHYTSAFTFIYSPRVGTPAAKMVDNVSYDEKVKRFKELVSALEVDFDFYAKKMVGKTYQVLVEEVSKKNKELLSGYTENNKIVHFKGDKSLIGSFVNVKINESHLYSLMGEIVDNE